MRHCKKYDFQQKFYLYRPLHWTLLQGNAEFQSQDQNIAKEFLTDIRSGMDDEALMIRYGLQPRQLQSAFRQVINAGLATPLELSRRLSITKSQVREAFVEMGKAIGELD
jgi:hypothetical protein